MNPVYQEIKDSGVLPSPAGVALELVRLVEDDGTTMEQITAVVESDPAIAARLVKVVNSPLVGLTRHVASVAMAVKLLGMHAVKNLAVGFSLLSSDRKGASKSFDYDRYWSESLARAVAARCLSERMNSCSADEAFTVALLSRIGRLAFATVFPKKYDAVLSKAARMPHSALLEAETNAFNINHNELAAEMMADWHFAAIFSDAVRRQDDVAAIDPANDERVTRIARLLHLADTAAHVMVQPRVYREDLALVLAAADHHGMARESVVAALDAANEEWRTAGAIFAVDTADTPSLRAVHTQASRHTRRILLVDADAQAVAVVAKQLRDASYEVITVSNGVAALAVLHEQECDIVITDWSMREMGGGELCRAIRSAEGIGFIYIIVLSATADADSLSVAFEAGADDFLAKPCRPEELLSRLKAGVRTLALQAKLVCEQRAAHKTNAELATLNQKLQKMATTDALTGLYNRREAMSRLEEYWATSVRTDQPLACMIFDIDHFKQCNDSYGHAAGDAVLRATAQVLARCARTGEAAFRVGGEEFLILCPGGTAEAAAGGAERLRGAIAGNRIECAGSTLAVTVSAGVAMRDSRLAAPDDLLKLADEALYDAKSKGRNCVRAADQDRPSARSAGVTPDTRPPQALRPLNGIAESRGTVLVVDDDPDARRMFRKVLEQDQFHVHEARDGREALEALKELSPDVILMDGMMPQLDGFECTRMVRSDPEYGDIPIVMITGNSGEIHLQAGLDAGAEEYITKPIKPREFLQRVRAMMRVHDDKASLTRSNEVRGEQARAMGILSDYSRALAGVSTTPEVVDRATAATAELTGCRRVAVLLPDRTGEQLSIYKAIGMDDKQASRFRVPLASTIAGQVFSSGESAVINAAEDVPAGDTQYNSEFCALVPSACVALATSERILGVLSATDRPEGKPFGAHDLEYLDVVCNMTASALEQIRDRGAREQAYVAIVTGLAKLAEHRDEDTGNHLERVTCYALVLARQLRRSQRYGPDIDGAFLDELRQAMPLHDIGKVAVPDAVLFKPGPLSDDEFAAMKRHPEIGARAIESVIQQAPGASFLYMARDIARFHHEWFDGSGYPQGLTGRKIPLTARIAAVADVYDALTSARPYKEAFDHEKSVEILRKQSGTHFDPEVIDAFFACEDDIIKLAARLRDTENAATGVDSAKKLHVACSPTV